MKKFTSVIWGSALVLLIALVAFPGRLPAQKSEGAEEPIATLKPIDEGGQNADFKQFRERFFQAIKERDATFVWSIIDPEIKIGFGGDDGIAAAKKNWNLDSPDSPMWQEFEDMLKLGGIFEQNEGERLHFIAPYVYARFPSQFDSFLYSAIVGENVRVRQSPSLSAPVIETLSYDIVKLGPYSEKKETIDGRTYRWVAVELADGRKGYVYGKYIRSPVDYRAFFEKRNNQWILTLMVSGD